MKVVVEAEDKVMNDRTENERMDERWAMWLLMGMFELFIIDGAPIHRFLYVKCMIIRLPRSVCRSVVRRSGTA
ncbi:hypothetical protein QR680_002414 [Steinernema hermaphroditum]|uniref:Uncharacterized protein n=1 Tax=Steinernema hermaphroditum TaxID=289476 RepID=A0AA39H3I2_9BILA|nr:hypothetical protein QR680_002414 [Steinernema hermaphroditum]